MKTLSYITVLLITSFCFSQEKLEADSIEFEMAVNSIEASSDLKFYYRPEWVKGIKISSSKINTTLPIEDRIQLLLEDTQLNYFLDRRKVILLDNTTIMIPQVMESNDQQVENTVDEFDQLIFSQEDGSNNDEDRLFAVGDIKKYKKGTESTVTGVVNTKEGPMEGVYIFSANPFRSAISDKDGRYTINLPSGSHLLSFQSVTTIDTRRRIVVYSDGVLNVDLDIDVVALEEVVVNAQREKNVESNEMGLVTIDPKELSVIPALLGEKDVIKAATSTAGIQNVGEGSAGINIRGGKADQNLFLLDNNTVFTTNHFFGFFSAFNSRAVGGLSIYKNGIPTEYGGRLSSVFNVDLKTPDQEKWEVAGGIGPVTSQVQAEGPVVKGKSSVLINGRGTYSEYILDQFENTNISNNNIAFYDFMAKSSTKLSEKDEFSFMAYYSYDAFQIQTDTLLSFSEFNYENKIIGGYWKHVFNENLFGILEVGNSNFGYTSGYDVLPSQAFNVDLFVNEFRAAAKFDYYINEKLNYKFGFETKLTRLSPGKKSPSGSESLIEQESIDSERGLELAPYVSAIYNFSEDLSVEAGIRYSIFNAYGPSLVNQYAEGLPRQTSSVIGQEEFGKNEVTHSNHGPEFRAVGRYSLNNSTSLKAGYNRTRQNIHLLLNAASIAPTDVWRLSGPFIEPQIADQVSVGLFKNFFRKHLIETSAEIYYKRLYNLLDFKTGAELQFNPAVETDLLQGDGKSYGLELSVKKTAGWLSGWLNYTYSRSFIRLDGDNPSEIVNGGTYFPTGYDKPHYINSVTNYKFTRRLTMTLNMVFASGIPITYPVGKWDYRGSENILYSDRNEFRIPNYFRLDLGFNINASHKLKKFTHSSWTFSVYNLLGRDNVYSIFFAVEEGEINGYQMSVFPTPIPTVTYNFRF